MKLHGGGSKPADVKRNVDSVPTMVGEVDGVLGDLFYFWYVIVKAKRLCKGCWAHLKCAYIWPLFMFVL